MADVVSRARRLLLGHKSGAGTSCPSGQSVNARNRTEWISEGVSVTRARPATPVRRARRFPVKTSALEREQLEVPSWTANQSQIDEAVALERLAERHGPAAAHLVTAPPALRRRDAIRPRGSVGSSTSSAGQSVASSPARPATPKYGGT